MEKNKAKCGGYGMFTSIFWVIGLGIILGILLGIPFKPRGVWDLSQLAGLLASGIAFAYIVLSIVDWFIQWRALAANPLPRELDLSDRAVASERLAALKGCSPLHRHIRRLLSTWAAGASGPQVVAMEGNQMLRTLVILAAETAAILVLLIGSASFGPPPALLTLGSGFIVLVVLLAIARFQLASQLAGYIESHLMARIGNDTTAGAGIDFVQTVAKTVADSMATLGAAQVKSTDLLVKAQNQVSAQLTKAQQDAAAQMAKTQQEASVMVAKAHDDMSAKLSSTQEQTATQLAKAQTEIATQLGRVTAIASTIDNVLKLQQSVDGTIKGITVTDQFQSMLVELRRHLAESDELLKNAAKPRSIRLVEKENE